ncbi:hypothetical protein [Anaerosacchariphilus polymeriproducens]|uniref:Uncharacterized protein n=1 Tax=Anaerosacchariphilus polymeriproducens TaxID=1812858 RepID=A0A371AQR3_9FIRM|nr:hypothetical protein [Anaerosacchariphilus polymeriproducens]RDU21916.1 hypothetical protein DWV06_18220 [Anaerosacchariphilus polymeriproducens]
MACSSHTEDINEFFFSVIETDEYKEVEYLIFSIRKHYLHFMADMRGVQFEIPAYLEKFVDLVIDRFNKSGISTVDILQYMLDNDINGWINYYANVFIVPTARGEKLEAVKDLNELFAFVMTGYILDSFRESKIDIRVIAKDEKLLYDTNQYGLSIVNGVEFHRDYFVFEDKAYLYSMLTNTNTIDFGDSMPGFARIISSQIQDGNILLRLDDRLAVPINQAISYSSLNFEKYRGPQFHFSETILRAPKTITIHIDEETADKLLLVVKQKYDDDMQKAFLHIELETLPYKDKESKGQHCITTFLHGMYYPEDDIFTHIDCAKNQYAMTEYVKKYSECSEDVPVDLYTEINELHHKIWCVEKGQYSREVWYDLMIVSLSGKYRKLLDEILQ